MMPWIVGGAALLLLAWLIGQHFKEERALREAYDAANDPDKEFLRKWQESEDAHKNIA